MRTTTVLLLIFIAFPVYGFDEWSRSDIALEALCIGLKMIDRHQTLEAMSKDGDIISEYKETVVLPTHKKYIVHQKYHSYYEINPLLGKNPSRHEVNLYFLISSLVHVGGAIVLPKTVEIKGMNIYPRRIWQYTFISISSALIFHNYQLGLSIEF